MTEGSLKLKETARTSRSYTEMISTFPWHHSVTAFCQWTILRGSYDALRSSVCSTETLGRILPDEVSQCQRIDPLRIVLSRSDNVWMVTHRRYKLGRLLMASFLAIASLTSACASTGANKPRPFPSPAGTTAAPVPPASPPTPPQAIPPGDQPLVATALSFRGTPYRSGGSDPAGFDC